MTNQNVVVPDTTKSKAVVTMAISNSTLFCSAIPKPISSSPTRRSLISCKRKILQAQGVNEWIDSMRSSSPTNLNQDLNNKSYTSWMKRHPSALDMFEEIMTESRGKKIVMFLDYDGTLSPIVDDPDRAFMSDEMRAAVRETAKHFPTAIVTGRCRDKVYNFVRLAELHYAGSHGMDIKGPAKGKQSVLFQAAQDYLPMIDEIYKVLVEKTKSTPGASIENNKFCVSVHFRRVDEKRWAELAEQVREVLTGYPKLRLTEGRKIVIFWCFFPLSFVNKMQVLEIRPSIKWDKGKALEFLLESLGFANSDDVLPVYIGDDQSDEDAFNALRMRNQGFGILVSRAPKETNASYTLQEPSEVMFFLQRLVEWKRLSLRGYR